MRRLLPILFLLSMLIPLAVIGWLGLRVAAEEQTRVQRQFEELLEQRLRSTAQEIEQIIEQRRVLVARRLEGLGRGHTQIIGSLRRGIGGEPIFLLDPEGQLIWPSGADLDSDRLRDFVERTRHIWDEHLLPSRSPAEPPVETYWAGLSRDEAMAPAREHHGWYSWHWGNGLSLLYWERLADGYHIGMEIERLGLLAAVIAALPSGDGGMPEDRIMLRDSRERVLYQWGGLEPGEGRRADAALVLRAPVESWRLEYYSGHPPGGGTAQRIQILSGIGALSLVLLGIALVLYRELTRAMREAAQRVNFVNQVSHELKTPLTNIRMYAELLQLDLDPEEPGSRRVEVIVAETRRLSRLIANILSFARNQRSALTLHLQQGSLDDCIREQAEQFAPGFEERGIALVMELRAADTIRIDPDAVAQIVGNLLSNCEKYAGRGGRVELESRLTEQGAELVVQDDGPGIARAHRSKLFRPFYRVRNDLTEGVSGTGIGLSIARELARLHGGDLRLLDCRQGARFLLTLPRGHNESIDRRR